MPETSFICYNGDFLPSNKPLFFTQNRAFRYGDGLFESMRAIGTSVPFLNQHLDRLRKGASFLQMEIPETFNNSFISKLISHLINANKQFAGAKIRLGVFRKDGGSFFPNTNKIDFYIESSPLDSANFQTNSKGLVIDVFTELTKSISEFNQLKSVHSLLYIKAALNSQSRNLDDCLILNEHKNIIESTSSNLFIFSDNNLITPSLSEGCLPGIMRNIIINIALKEKITVYDDVSLNEKDLINADEVFLTNAVNGIKWVVAFKNRRYFSKTAKKLSVLLADYANEVNSK